MSEVQKLFFTISESWDISKTIYGIRFHKFDQSNILKSDTATIYANFSSYEPLKSLGDAQLGDILRHASSPNQFL